MANAQGERQSNASRRKVRFYSQSMVLGAMVHEEQNRALLSAEFAREKWQSNLSFDQVILFSQTSIQISKLPKYY